MAITIESGWQVNAGWRMGGTGQILNLDPGVAASYPGSGTAWNDISGANNNFTWTVAPPYVASPPSFLCARNDNKTCSSLTNFLGSNMSMSAWIKTTNVGDSALPNKLLCIMAGLVSGSLNDWSWGLTNLGFLSFASSSATGTYSIVTTSTAVNTGLWTYLVVTRSITTGEVRIYINGAINVSGTGSVGNALNGAPNIYVACKQQGGLLGWGGNMAQVEAYDYVVSDADVLADFTATRGTYGV